jgi:hypothetical protein
MMQAGFRISPNLLELVLQKAGEVEIFEPALNPFHTAITIG